MVAMFVVVALTAILVIGVGSALADPPDPVDGGPYFLCPAVGAGVENHRGPSALDGSDAYTFIPGHNQAGAHVNPNGTNQNGLPSPTNVPGQGNSNWGPIWNAVI
jgi:hypothetical protein